MGHRGVLGWLVRSGGEPFARASEEPYRRRLADGVRLLVAALAAVWLASDSGHNSALALSVFHAINGLPGGLHPVSDLLYDVATLWSVAVVAVAALWAGRWRLARDLLLAGALAWLTARGLGLIAENGLRHGLSVTLRSRASTGFPNVPLAVVVAVVSTAAPYLTRSLRWVGRGIAFMLVPVEMYLGEALPKSVFCAVAVGVVASAVVHVGFGSPAGRPTAAQVEAALQDLGVLAAGKVRLAAQQPSEHTLMLADDGDASLVIKVLGRDERDAQRLAKLWRFVLYRDAGPAPYLTRLQEVEHQAYVMLLAQSAGVQVPPVIVAGSGGPDTVLLAERRLPGTVLTELAAGSVSDEVLADAWLQVGQLHHARVAHGRLTAAHILVHDDRAWLIGFADASASVLPEQQAIDTAGLLATTAGLFGTERAVTAGVRGLGPEGLAAALPFLQPGVLSREARRMMGPDLADQIAELRTAAAASVDVPLPDLERLRRVSGPTAALALGVILAVGSLLSAVGDPGTVVRLLGHARPALLVDAAALAVASNVGFMLALTGSTRRRLPVWANFKVQLAGVFSNIAFPLGSQALQIRFLQKQGLSVAAAVTCGGIVNLTGGTLAQVGLLALALQASPATVDLGQIPTGALTTTLELVILAALVATLVVLVVRPLRRRVWPPMARSAQSLLEVLRSPRQLLLLVGGSALAYVLSSLALAATLQAFGLSLPLSEAIAVSTGVTLIAALVPIPGGGGAVSAVGLSGALVSLRIPEGGAVATALTFQLLTQYVPALPGWLALRSLLKDGDL